MRQIITCLTLLALAALPAAAAEEKTLDLAFGGTTSVVEAGTELSFKLVNMLGSADYSYEIEIVGPVEPFDVTIFGEAAADDACVAIVNRLRDAYLGDSEAKLRAELALAEATSPAKCKEAVKAFKAATQATLDDTVTVGEGQTVTVLVWRIRPSYREWRFVFSTGQQRGWLVHYGFAFLPDENDEFFTRKADPVEGQADRFLILQAADRGGAEFEPTVNFTYVPSFSGRKARKPLFTAGLGADLDERLVFAGVSWVIGDNVSLFVGAAGHKQTRLKGRYELGQELAEALEADQLVDETFDLNAIVGVGFRFNGNPFKKKAEAADAGKKDDTKKDGGKKQDGKKDEAKNDGGATPGASTSGATGSESPVTDPPSQQGASAVADSNVASGDGASGIAGGGVSGVLLAHGVGLSGASEPARAAEAR